MTHKDKLKYRALYWLRIRNAVAIAKRMGVKIKEGKGTRVLDDPTHVFGTEPYLVTIGEHVEITYGVKFITHDGACWVLRSLLNNPELDFFQPIEIGNNVFIGTKSVILPGVHIGDNVVIGAGSVVTKDIPSNSVAAGVPCKVIKSIEEYAEKGMKHGAVLTKNLPYKKKQEKLEQIFYNKQ